MSAQKYSLTLAEAEIEDLRHALAGEYMDLQRRIDGAPSKSLTSGLRANMKRLEALTGKLYDTINNSSSPAGASTVPPSKTAGDEWTAGEEPPSSGTSEPEQELPIGADNNIGGIDLDQRLFKTVEDPEIEFSLPLFQLQQAHRVAQLEFELRQDTDELLNALRLLSDNITEFHGDFLKVLGSRVMSSPKTSRCGGKFFINSHDSSSSVGDLIGTPEPTEEDPSTDEDSIDYEARQLLALREREAAVHHRMKEIRAERYRQKKSREASANTAAEETE